MCNLSDEIENTKLQDIRNLMKNLKLSSVKNMLIC